VGNRVVDVEEVEGFGLEDLEHLGGESEGVRRMVEEGVGSDLDLMKMDVGLAEVHADGRGVGDEMDVVAAGGELLAELGGDDTGAAVGGIACDADAHGFLSRSPRQWYSFALQRSIAMMGPTIA